MHQKFFTILFLGLISLILNTVGYAGKYTDAFEYAVSHHPDSFACQSINVGAHPRYFTYEGSVEVGHSVGPSGTTKHYEKQPITGYSGNTPDRYVCKYCREDFPFMHCGIPSVKFTTQENNRIVMTISPPKSFFNSLGSICSKPHLHNKDLIIIWEKAKKPCYGWQTGLELMWKAARELDEEEAKKLIQEAAQVNLSGKTTDNIKKMEYVVEEIKPSSSFCCCIQ